MYWIFDEILSLSQVTELLKVSCAKSKEVNSIVLLTNVNHVIDLVYTAQISVRKLRDTWIITAGLGPGWGYVK